MIDSAFFKWVILPLLIFTARIFDVSLQTMRIIFISKGKKILAPLLGFFEVLIWLMAITQIMRNLTNPLYYLAYGSGFAMGTFIGLLIEEKLAVGIVLLRIITQKSAPELVACLRAENFGVTIVDAEGISGRVKIIFMVLDRCDLARVIDLVHRHNPKAFFSVEDVRIVDKGFFPIKKNNWMWIQRK